MVGKTFLKNGRGFFCGHFSKNSTKLSSKLREERIPANITRVFGIDVCFRFFFDSFVISYGIKKSLKNIVSEILTNITRHRVFGMNISINISIDSSFIIDPIEKL